MSDNKRKSFYKTEIDTDNGVLTISFPDRDHLLPIIVRLSQLTTEIRDYAALHGLCAKLVDAMAIPRSTQTGLTASVGEKLGALREVFERITDPINPSWNKTREGGNGTNDSLLAQALCRMTGKSRTEINTYLADKSREAKTALKSSPRVAEVIAQIQREKLSAEVSADDLLSDLGI